MNDFNDQLARDAAHIFLSDDDFAEWITAEPWQEAPVRIKALIDRDPASSIEGLKGSANYQHEVRIARSDCDGLVGIDVGKTVLKYPLRVGDAQCAKFLVMKVLGPEDQGMWKLAVRQS